MPCSSQGNTLAEWISCQDPLGSITSFADFTLYITHNKRVNKVEECYFDPSFWHFDRVFLALAASRHIHCESNPNFERLQVQWPCSCVRVCV